uniref:Uncharacterized protein n=1 Tax=Arion vulgaris TaxID=1028688 RepID=A0A0B7A9H7_9EUPU
MVGHVVTIIMFALDSNAKLTACFSEVFPEYNNCSRETLYFMKYYEVQAYFMK